MALELYLLRHGETETRQSGGYCGRLRHPDAPDALDTAQDSPADILERDRQVAQIELSYRANPRSVVVLEARADKGNTV